MNRSKIFRNAHKAVRTSIKMNWADFKGMTYAQRLSVFLKREYKKAAPAKAFTIKLDYSQTRLRKLVKQNGGTWNSASKTWTIVCNSYNLPYELEQYVVADNAPAPAKTSKGGRTEWLVNGKAVRNNLNYAQMYERDPFMNWE